MLKRKLTIPALIIISLAVLGCSSSNSSGEGDGQSLVNDDPDNPTGDDDPMDPAGGDDPTGVNDPVDPAGGGNDPVGNGGGTSTPTGGGIISGGGGSSPFDGTWASGCVTDGDPDFPSQFDEYEITNVAVGNGIFTVDVYSYTDAACSIPSDPAVFSNTSSFVITGGTTTTPLGEALHVDVTIETIAFDGQAPSAEELAVLESFGTFDVMHDLILELNGRLYVGEFTFELDGSTPAKRPVTLELVEFVTRQ